MTKCQNCGITQGPFERESAGTRTMPIILVGCARGPLTTIDGKPHYAGAHACAKRRELLDAKRYGVRVSR